MRTFVLMLGCTLALTIAAPVRAQSLIEKHLTQFLKMRSVSPVVIDRLAPAGRAGVPGLAQGTTALCLSFHDADPRTATSIQFAFVYYDDGGTRTSTQIFTRSGSFATGVRFEGSNRDNDAVQLDDCVRLERPSSDAIVVAYYVDHVVFADGSSWSASGFAFPDRAVPGTLAPVVPPPASGASAAMTLPALVKGTYPSCASAQAISRDAADDSILVDVKPGRPIGNGLSHIGAASTCVSSGDAIRDAAAMAAAETFPLAIVREAALAVELPVIAVSATCTAPPRVLERELVSSTSAQWTNETAPMAVAPPGDYIGIARVDVRADGYPAAVRVTRSTQRVEFDDALRYSALESRFWPAVQNGVPVAADFDFAMRWSLVPDAAVNGRNLLRVYGPAMKPLPAECVVPK